MPKKSASKKSKSKKNTAGMLFKVEQTKLSEDKLDVNKFYCVKCRALCFSRKTDVSMKKTKRGQPMLSGKCANLRDGQECRTKVNKFVSRK
jgi:hypothetical protein